MPTGSGSVPAEGWAVPRGAAAAISGPSGTLTYAELRKRIADRADACQPGQRVAVCGTDPAQVLISVLAAAAAGATAVVVDPTWPAGQRAAALRAAGVDGGLPGAIRQSLAWIGFTSGSAGTPRPIGRTAESWRCSFPLVSERTGITAETTVLIGGSLASSLFLFGALHALWAGAHVLAPGRWDPEGMPNAEVAHCVPAMLDDLLGTRHPPELAICGGATLPETVRARAGGRGTAIAEYYGATELSFVAWRDPRGRLLPFPGVELRIRDREIWARSPYLSAGYVSSDSTSPGPGGDATSEVTGPLRWDEDGFATVGDLGALGPDGALTVLGRGDSMIMTGGSPVLPQDVESVLTSVPGVRDAVVVGTPHPRIGAVVTAVIEPFAGTHLRLADLRTATRARLAAPQRPRHWYLIDRLPRTGSGKPARGAIAAAVCAGVLPGERLR